MSVILSIIQIYIWNLYKEENPNIDLNADLKDKNEYLVENKIEKNSIKKVTSDILEEFTKSSTVEIKKSSFGSKEIDKTHYNKNLLIPLKNKNTLNDENSS